MEYLLPSLTISVTTPLTFVNFHEIVCLGMARASQTNIVLDPSLIVNVFSGEVIITGIPVNTNNLLQVAQNQEMCSVKHTKHNYINV